MKWNGTFSCLFWALIIVSSKEAQSQNTTNVVPDDLLYGSYDRRKIVPGELCDRECSHDTPSLRCYFSLTMEDYSVRGGACLFCQPPNAYDSFDTGCTCVDADGIERTFMSLNRRLPSPLLQGCKGDMMIIDAVNRYQGGATTIHWHGIDQKRTPWSDGVPYVTQCPIIYGTSYRYYFDLEDPGTYFYHSHAGLDKYNGNAGALIVRRDKKREPCGHMYDRDDTVMFIQDWLHESPKERFPGTRFNNSGSNPDSLLINGRGKYVDAAGGETNVSLAHFYIKSGERTRIRLVNAFATACSAILSIENHTMTVVEKDSQPIRPVTVNSIMSMTGERFDFIVEGNMTSGDYWIQLKGTDVCTPNITQWAVLHYNSSSTALPTTTRPTFTNSLPLGKVINYALYCNETYICANQIVGNSSALTREHMKKKAKKIYLPFELNPLDAATFYASKNYSKFLSVTQNGLPVIASMRNISFNLPSSPLLTQYDDIPKSQICRSCIRNDSATNPCRCTNIIKLKPCKTYEIILIDNVFSPNPFHHPIHIHGYFFCVIARGYLSDLNISQTNYTQAAFEEADRQGLIKRNLNWTSPPPMVDTVITPQYGYVVIRLYSDNLGFWFVHCHILTHIVIGMEAVLQVGNRSDMLPIPYGIPKCGNFKPTALSGPPLDYCPYDDKYHFSSKKTSCNKKNY